MEQKQAEGSGRSPGGRTAQSIVQDSQGIKLATAGDRRGGAGRLERSFGVRMWRLLNARPGHGETQNPFSMGRGGGFKGSGIFRWSVWGHLQEGQTREGLRPRRPENHGYGEQRGGALLGWGRKNWKGEMPKREPWDWVQEKQRENSGWNPWKLKIYQK